MNSSKKELHEMGIDQCLEEVIIDGTQPNIFFCVLKIGHKGFHKITIAQTAVSAIKLDDHNREKQHKKLVKKYERKNRAHGRYKEDLPQHYKW